MKFLKLGFALLFLSCFLPLTGRASDEKVTSLLFTCNVAFTAHGKSIYIGLGYTHFEGKGTLSCFDLLTGESEHFPLKVNAVGPGVGLGVTGFDISGAATGIKIARSPESLLGRYVSVRADAAVGIGVGASVPIRVSKNDVSINVSIEGLAGIGGGVDLLAVDIEAAGEKQIDTPAPALAATPPTPIVPIPQPTPVATTKPVADAPVAPAPGTGTPQAQSIVYVQDNQPVNIVDSGGHLLETIYLKPKPN